MDTALLSSSASPEPAATPRQALDASRGWPAVAHGLTAAAFMLGPLAWWFVMADRSAVFLYGHLGAGPFDSITAGRHVMAPAVAGGALLLVYAAANWVCGRLVPAWQPPGWLASWLVAVPFIVCGVPAITMILGDPPLPASLACQSTAMALAGAALALGPGKSAARDPGALIWLALRGAAVAPVLVLFKALELPARLNSVSPGVALTVALSSLAASLVGLIVLGAASAARGRPVPLAAATYVSGLAVAYLLLPLAHHLLATPPAYRYITASGNFFAAEPILQAAVLLPDAAVSIAASRVTRITKRL